MKSKQIQRDVRPYFAISNCLVFPSYREGFPNVVMQAGSMGLPSIVSNINGCNEIIEEGINGTIIPSKDIESLFSSMQKIINDDVWRNQLASNARDKIVYRFEQQLVWDALLNEYNNLLIENSITF
jgi:glycosyltransferase involved in cell wall biosynthesis